MKRGTRKNTTKIQTNVSKTKSILLNFPLGMYGDLCNLSEKTNETITSIIQRAVEIYINNTKNIYPHNIAKMDDDFNIKEETTLW